ncbi:MAG: Fe-S cluster assembly protein SufB [Gemmatimonadales bacterium]
MAELDLDRYKYDFVTEGRSVFKSRKGLDEEVVRQISAHKEEPGWMLEFRLKALQVFESKPMPDWGGDLDGLDLDEIYFYLRPQDRMEHSWDDVPQEIKDTFDFSTVVPTGDNKFAALNSAVWSGGSFVYIPKGVKVEIPLQAYFRVNAEQMGQFERTLIIADEGSEAHYIEGCTAPVYTTDSFHSGVIEIIVKPNARFRYTTIQNWSNNMYNLVTQRALVHEGAYMEWLDGNLGSKLTMKYPSCFLVGEGAHGQILSIAYASDGQHQDTGGKVVHVAPNTTSQITSKSISKGNGRASYRGLLKVYEGATAAKSNVECDALLLSEKTRTDTYPYIEIDEETASIGHEATVSKVGDEQLFYLTSRGLSEEQAMTMVVRGFIEPIARELPLEYAIELNRLVELEMEGSVG